MLYVRNLFGKFNRYNSGLVFVSEFPLKTGDNYYNSLAEAIEVSPSGTRIRIKKGNYIVNSAIRISKYLELDFEREANIIGTVNYGIGNEGVIVYTGGGYLVRISGYGNIYSYGTAPALFVHAGLSGTSYAGYGSGLGDMVIKLNSIYASASSYCVNLDDAALSLSINYMRSDNEVVAFLVSNSELYNYINLRIGYAESKGMCIYANPPYSNHRFHITQSYFKNIGTTPNHVILNAGFGSFTIEDTLIHNATNTSGCHGIEFERGPLNLINTGIYIKNSSSYSASNCLNLSSVNSISNRNVFNTVQTSGTLNIDPDYVN